MNRISQTLSSSKFVVESTCLLLAGMQGLPLVKACVDLVGLQWAGSVLVGACLAASVTVVGTRIRDRALLRTLLTAFGGVAIPGVLFVASVSTGAGYMLGYVSVAIPMGAWIGALRPIPKVGRRHVSFQMSVDPNNGLDPLIAVSSLSILAFSTQQGTFLWCAMSFQMLWIGLSWSLLSMDQIAGPKDVAWMTGWIKQATLFLLPIVTVCVVAGFLVGGHGGAFAPSGGLFLGPRIIAGIRGQGHSLSHFSDSSGFKLDADTVIRLLASLGGIAGFALVVRYISKYVDPILKQLREGLEQRRLAWAKRRKQNDLLQIARRLSDPFAHASEADSPQLLFQKFHDALWVAGVPVDSNDGVYGLCRKAEKARFLSTSVARKVGRLFSEALYGGSDGSSELSVLVFEIQNKAFAGIQPDTLAIRGDVLKLRLAKAHLERDDQLA